MSVMALVRILKLTAVGAVVVILSAVASAEENRPANGRVYYAGEDVPSPSPSDLPPPPVTVQDSFWDSECESGCCRCDNGCCGNGCGLGDPCKLLQTCCMKAHNVDAGGWVQGGFYNYNTGMFNDYPDNFNVNQVWLYSEKALDAKCGWDWGYRVDYVYGTDAPDTQSFGNQLNTYDFGWFNGAFYGHAVPQLYGEVGYGDLSVKLGHFYTIIGYEVVAAPDNFFYSHAFTMYYAEPFTHSGFLATYEANDQVTWYGGWSAGYDTGFDRFEGDIFLGGFSVGLGENVTATYACTVGRLGFGTNLSGYSHSVVVDVQLSEKLNYVFQSDYINYDGIVTHPASLMGLPLDPVLLYRYGVNNYLFYEINERLKAGIRLEWFNVEEDPQGDRSDLYEVTFGFNYRPHANFVIRPELRWEQDNDGFTVDPARNNQVGFGMDMILMF